MRVINLDVDGVVADILPAWLAVYNREHGDTLRPEDITTWDFGPLTKIGSKVYEYLADPTWYEHVPMVEGAWEGVRLLRNVGFEVRFVTASKIETVHARAQWLERHGFLASRTRQVWEAPEDLVVARNKRVVRGDVLVDDYAGNLRGWPGRTVLFEQAHNRSEPPGPWWRARGWPELTIWLLDERTWSVTGEAERLVYGDRGSAYGHPADDYGRTAALWSVILGQEVTAEQAVLCMIAVKMSRLCCTVGHTDSLVDVAGYAECLRRVVAERARREGQRAAAKPREVAAGIV